MTHNSPPNSLFPLNLPSPHPRPSSPPPSNRQPHPNPPLPDPQSFGSQSPDRIDPVLARLKRLHPKVIDLSLARVERLLTDLGRPQAGLPPVVHVAGTNGKGSTIAFLRAFLEAAGLRVHVYTSPHLVRFHERIRVAGTLIDDGALAALLEECETVNAGRPITFFEVTTAAAFLAFARTPADVVLLETGLGGRLDATNVIERPAATAITRISFDHMQYLGATLAEIATEKAGIFKPGATAVIAPQPGGGVLDTLRDRAAAVGAPVICYDDAANGPRGRADAGQAGTEHADTWRIVTGSSGFRFESAPRTLDLPLPALPGAHQLINAGTAIACLDPLRLPVSDDAVRDGLARVTWPARLQRLTTGPLVAALPRGWELWLDGGHNDSAGEVLAGQAAQWRRDGRPLYLIVGMLATKQTDAFLRPLVPYVAGLRAVPVPAEDAAQDPAVIAAVARDVGIENVAAMAAPAAALASLRTLPGEAARILICGSLYLAGAVLAANA